MIKKIFDQFKNEELTPISGLDATFLYGDTYNSPMHIGAVNVIEGSLKFEDFKATIASRLHQMPRLRQRLLYVPMSIDYPYWVDDPNFDIDLHIKHVALPKPGNWKALRKLASSVFSDPLSQERPLWEFVFVEGLDNIPQVPSGSVAVISKVHHVLIDGVAGAGLMSIVFDLSPEKKEIPAPRPYHPKPLPNDIQLIMKSTMGFAEKPLKFPKLLSNIVSSTIKSGTLTRVQHANLPTAPFTAPPTPMNGIISPLRKWNTAILSFSRIKELKKIMDVTFNDVILAICAGALRKYLNDKNKLPKKPLVAMVPISTRTQAETNSTDNQISSMLIQLGTNIEDPIERLETIHENTIRGKTYQNAIGAKTLAKMAEVVPFGIGNQAARLYSRYNIASMHNPVMNLTITNVPGPQFPLYINGHKLLSVMGMAPIIDGMGLIITVFSYNGLVTLSPTSDAKSMPDIDLFSRYIRESANYLEEKILAHKAGGGKKKKAAPKKKETLLADKVFAHFKKQLKEQEGLYRPGTGLYQFELTSSNTLWRVDLTGEKPNVRKGKVAEPDATFVMKDEHFAKLAKGEMGVQTAFIQGRLKVNGDFKLAMRLGKVLSLMNPFEG